MHSSTSVLVAFTPFTRNQESVHKFSFLARYAEPDGLKLIPLCDLREPADLCYVPLRSVFVSFGGLLMHLRGDESNLKNLDLDSRVYLLMRKN